MLEEIESQVLFAKGYVDGAATHSHNLRARFQLARGAILENVRVLIFGCDATYVLQVLEGMRREASAAAVVVEILRAIHQLLLTQVPELPVSFHVVRFQAAHRRESPATSAMTLVLNRRHYAIVTPVPMTRQLSQQLL